MKTEELYQIIGVVVKPIVVAPPYGYGSIHSGGFVSCDPCYLGADGEAIRSAYREKYPWDGYDYKARRESWSEFIFKGKTCWSRDCGDGVGYFGNSVDAGYVFVFPLSVAPLFVLKL